MAWGRDVAKLLHEPAEEPKQRIGDDDDENALEDGEDELEVAGFFDAEIVEAGHEPGDADGEDLRPEQRHACGDRRGEPVKCGEDAEGARESAGDGGDGCGLGDGKPCPHVKEGGGVAVGAAQVDIFAAGIGQHGAELGVGHGAKEREQAADDPREIDEGR